MYRGRLRITVPVLWTLCFMVTFTIGGMTGVLLAIPGADYVLHNSLFLIAHFHNTIIGGAVFGYLAGFAFWFPKAMGFKLDESWGRRSFWCWLIGFFVAFMPLYVLGFLGMTRRLNHTNNPDWNIWLYIAAGGAVIIMFGILFQVVQLVVSLKTASNLMIQRAIRGMVILLSGHLLHLHSTTTLRKSLMLMTSMRGQT